MVTLYKDYRRVIQKCQYVTVGAQDQRCGKAGIDNETRLRASPFGQYTPLDAGMARARAAQF
jgi:hypothetical protein